MEQRVRKSKPVVQCNTLTIRNGFINILELLRDGFGEDCYFKVLLAELASPPNGPPSSPNGPPSLSPSASPPEQDDRVIGYALYYFTYNSQQGKTVYLEDVLINATYRGKFIPDMWPKIYIYGTCWWLLSL